MLADLPISGSAISSVDDAVPTPPAPTTLLPELRPVMIYGTAAYRADMGNDFGGVDIVSVLERIDLTIAGVNRDGTPRIDPSSTKLLREIWPILRGTPGQVINIFAGAKANSTEDTITWQGPFPFTIGINTSVQPLIEGVFLAIRYQAEGEANWSLLGHVLDLEETGGPY